MDSPVFWFSACCLVEIGALLLTTAIAKYHDYSSWMAWCFVLPPLVFVLAALPRQDTTVRANRSLPLQGQREKTRDPNQGPRPWSLNR